MGSILRNEHVMICALIFSRAFGGYTLVSRRLNHRLRFSSITVIIIALSMLTIVLQEILTWSVTVALLGHSGPHIHTSAIVAPSSLL